MKKGQKKKEKVVKPDKGGKKKGKAETNDGMSTDQKLDILIGAVGKLVELQTASGSRPVDKDDDSVTKKMPEESYHPKMDDETYPDNFVPKKYRKIVDDILSPEFGIRVNDFEDRTEFQVDIVVPAKYSSLTTEDKERGVEDIRTRIVPRALGENGVREWCELIRKNLSRYYSKEGVQSPFKNVE